MYKYTERERERERETLLSKKSRETSQLVITLRLLNYRNSWRVRSELYNIISIIQLHCHYTLHYYDFSEYNKPYVGI